jgi:lysophospholipase L1-like esterase
MNDLQRKLLLATLGPCLWLQGRYVRRVTPRLPEPDGPRTGQCGQGPRLRLLIAGDSAAAGVGASSQAQGLSGQLVQRLGDHFSVQWQLAAVTGHDSPALHGLLSDLPEQPFDVVVVSIGVNDVTALRSPRQWVDWQATLANLIHQRFGARLIVHSALPPMHAFTALPQPLRWYFGRWAKEMNRQLAIDLQGHPRRALHRAHMDEPSQGLASDGFHPGPRGYSVWAESLSAHILAEMTARAD